jgi:hypothetical protein
MAHSQIEKDNNKNNDVDIAINGKCHITNINRNAKRQLNSQFYGTVLQQTKQKQSISIVL